MEFAALLNLLCLFPWFAEPLPEAMHLPGTDAVRGAVEFGEAHRAWVDRQYMTPPRAAPMDPYWLAWRCECDACLQPWKMLQEARNPYRPMEERLSALERLRRHLGEDRWWRGQLGAPVPLERFEDTPHPLMVMPGMIAGK